MSKSKDGLFLAFEWFTIFIAVFRSIVHFEVKHLSSVTVYPAAFAIKNFYKAIPFYNASLSFIEFSESPLSINQQTDQVQRNVTHNRKDTVYVGER